MLKVGVAKEIKSDEGRVALTPVEVRELVASGAAVSVEVDAGRISGFADDAYRRAGATVVDTGEVWDQADLVVKVKEPTAAEYRYLREDVTVFSYLHLAADEPLTAEFLGIGARGIAFETVETADGRLPLLAPMSEIAGRLAVLGSAYFLERPAGGRGVLIGSPAGVEPANVIVLGGGTVGYNSALAAAGLGARVRVLDASLERLRHLGEVFGSSVELVVSTTEAIEQSVRQADVVIGAVLRTGRRAPCLLGREMLAAAGEGSVLCDVAVDQGGCFETTHPTTHADPTYVVDGVVHYCVSNLPGAVPVTASGLLASAILPSVKAMVEDGIEAALATDPALARGVNVADGELVHPALKGLCFETEP